MSPSRPSAPGRISPARLWIVSGASLIWAACVVHALFDLQVRRTDQMRELARRQQQQVIVADPRRGAILDRVGRELAVSTDVYSVYAAPGEMKDAGSAATSLASALAMPANSIRAKLSNEGFVLVRRRVAPDVADRVRSLDIAGVHLVAESKRFYPRGSLAAHVVGFVSPDEPSVREGLERRYDSEIRGTPGALVAMRDARGSHFLMEARQQPVAGHDILTSLDEVIQHIAERELAAAIQETGAISGSVVVLHTPTGEVLAMTSLPTFNPNHYGSFDAAARRNRSITDVYEPGSTFKIITAAAGLQEGVVRPSEIIDCQNGLIRVAGIAIHDHKQFGSLSFAEVISESSDIGVMKTALRIDPRTFYEYIARFGFGSRTGIDLPGESRGMLQPAARWAATTEAYISFGQEIGVTPLQIASAFSTVANRGVAVPPHIVTRIIEGAGAAVREPERPQARRVLSEAAADTLVDLLEGVVTSGTGKKAAVSGYRVAGKTGTAQKIVNKVYSTDKYISSFCGFVPSRRPVLTILVVLDEPRGPIYHGGDVAAPIFRRIAEPALDYLGVQEDGPLAQPPELALLGAGLAPPEQKRSAGEVVPAAYTTRHRPDRGAPGAKPDPRPPIDPVAPRPLTFDDGGATPAPPEGPMSVPDLDGAPLRDAVVQLARAGLIASVEGDGFVVTQSPAPGTPLAAGATVSLKLGRFVETMPPPAVATGKSRQKGGGGSAHDP